MTNRLGMMLLMVALGVASGDFPGLRRAALAQEAELDATGEAQAKEALRLYKQGLYDDAAKIFAKLSVDYPDMLIFERNLGACFYYLRKPGPAISNLRHYLSRKKDIAPDDKAVVERWIAEMERVREQDSAAKLPPPVPSPIPASGSTPAPGVSPAQMGSSPPGASTPAPIQPTAGPAAASVPGPVWQQQAGPSPAAATAAPSAQAPLPPAAQYSAIVPTSAPVSPAPAPAALDLSAQAGPSAVQDLSPPFYKTWWFWTGAVIVVGGAVSGYVVATHRETENACVGATIPCDAVK
jgi:hypothetical protein